MSAVMKNAEVDRAVLTHRMHQRIEPGAIACEFPRFPAGVRRSRPVFKEPGIFDLIPVPAALAQPESAVRLPRCIAADLGSSRRVCGEFGFVDPRGRWRESSCQAALERARRLEGKLILRARRGSQFRCRRWGAGEPRACFRVPARPEPRRHCLRRASKTASMLSAAIRASSSAFSSRGSTAILTGCAAW